MDAAKIRDNAVLLIYLFILFRLTHTDQTRENEDSTTWKAKIASFLFSSSIVHFA